MPIFNRLSTVYRKPGCPRVHIAGSPLARILLFPNRPLPREEKTGSQSRVRKARGDGTTKPLKLTFHKSILFSSVLGVALLTSTQVQAAEPAEDVMTVATVNFHPVWGENNIARIKGFAVAAAKQGADFIVFPEMALTGYDPDDENEGDERMQAKLAEPIPGPSTDIILEVAKKYDCVILFGMPEKAKDGLYNSSVACVSPDGTVQAYRKIHPFGVENTWCKKGDTPVIVDTKFGPIGVGICYDMYQFPELTRYYCAKGCRAVVNCTAQYGDPAENTGLESFEQYYMPTLASHVIANEIFVFSSNLVGLDNVTWFAGGSMVIGPRLRATCAPGDPVYKIYCGALDNNNEELFLATIDLSLANRSLYKNNPYTNVPDFRPDIYLKLYKELAQDAE